MGFPLIYDASATTYTTLGYGVLSEAVSCVVTEELNGLFELEMRYPVTGLHGEYITPGNIIVCTSSMSSGRQAFRIYEVTQDISGMATIHARHISYDLNGYPVDTFTASTLATALDGLLTNAVLDTPPFTIAADFTSTADFSVTEPSPIRSWFGGREGSIIDVYGGEWEYDNFSCTLKSRRGADNGARAQYSKNISAYTKNIKSDSQYSHVCAVWTDMETGTSVRGDFIETGAGGITRVKFLDASTDFEDQPTTAQLNAYATARTADYSNIALNIAVDVVPLNSIQDIIELGDTVHVYYQDDMYTTRCVAVAWNVIKEKYDRITVGQLRTSFASSISSTVAQDGYITRKDVSSMIQKASPVRIIESGTDTNGWDYKIYSDGTYEAIKRLTLSSEACTTTSGTLYKTADQSFTNRPVCDNGISSIQVSFWAAGSNRYGWAVNTVRPQATTIGSWAVFSTTNTAVSGTLAALVHGTSSGGGGSRAYVTQDADGYIVIPSRAV